MAGAIRGVCRLQPFIKNFSLISQQKVTAFTKPCNYQYQNACRSFSSQMNKLLSEIRFTEEHEWVRQEGSTPNVTVGITDYAQDSLGDIVFVELPEVGSQVVEKDSIGAIESVKAVSDVYCPASGTVTEVNTELESTPEVVNTSPLEDGWLFKMELADVSSLDTLLTEKEYKDYLHGLE